ncbi:hypothetical protein BDBG_17766 [Blastomyces gilchristii SLH14081]|uniref:Uncharacterized protein n=1 Tax=Blastomyces gilchristii (strain SLH14081) TaxID=559298 RepID=A0A179V1I0_BLAGS|nr:uncharacterized protein BDBG_17766 [Blastomyces gilchristii SLH14081]OAT13257.1 hypothetical protein BDBG_17766 [Blastomyces gilchristii SLH14081]
MAWSMREIPGRFSSCLPAVSATRDRHGLKNISTRLTSQYPVCLHDCFLL